LWTHFLIVKERLDSSACFHAPALNSKLKKQGGTVFIQVNATPIVIDGQVVSIQGMIRDVTERVQMKAALKDRAVLVQALLNASTQSMILLDLEMNFLGLNHAAAVALGQPLNALIGQSIFDVFPPHIARFRKTQVEQVIESGKPVRFEDEREGRIFDNYLYPVFDTQGRVSQVAVFAHDMTERRHAEQARAESEWRLQLALQNSPIMVFSQDQNLRYTWFYNAEPGFCTEQSIGQVYADLLSSEDAVHLGEIKRTVLETGIESRQTVEIVQDDQPRFYDFTILPQKDEQGNIVGIHSVALDVTGRIQAEQRSRLVQERILQQNRELVALNKITMTMSQNGNIEHTLARVLDQLLQVMDFSHGAIQILDHLSQSMGYAAAKGFSVSRQEQQMVELNAHIRDRLARSGQAILVYDRAEMPPPIAAFLKAEGVQAALSVPIPTQEGVVGLLSLFDAQPFMLSEPEVHLLTAVANQIGLSYENIRLAEQAAQIDVLTRLEKLRGELIANVSHELRTPLGLIEIAASSLSSQDVTFDDRARGKFIQIIAQETRRLSVLVENLLRLSQIENRQLRLDRQPTDLNKLILQVLDRMRIQSPDYQIVYEPADRPAPVVADAYALEQILLNLLGNAIKYSFKETPIRIRVRQDEKQVLVRVQDRGIGIPADELGRIFTRFMRGKHRLVQQAGGVGLGLAVCKELVEAHDGRIWVESELGVGTTVSFALPVDSGQAQAEG
ncbi:MAG: PAS domain-containing protein, partial [Anaerolineae bacterium]|nr:PAS domain-containing protein [Anaerolineae bacterium]